MPKITEPTPKQYRFIEYYCNPTSESFGNAALSYEKAGYSATGSQYQNANRLLNKDYIREEIKRYRDKTSQKMDVTRDYVLNKLQSILSDCESKGDRTNALRACQLLGQSIAMYTDKVQSEDVTRPSMSKEEEEQFREVARQLNIKVG